MITTLPHRGVTPPTFLCSPRTWQETFLSVDNHDCVGHAALTELGDQPARLEYRDGRLQLKDASSSPFPVAPLVTLDPTDDPAAFMVRGGRYSGELLRFSFASSGLVTGFMASGFSFIRLVDAADRP